MSLQVRYFFFNSSLYPLAQCLEGYQCIYPEELTICRIEPVEIELALYIFITLVFVATQGYFKEFEENEIDRCLFW